MMLHNAKRKKNPITITISICLVFAFTFLLTGCNTLGDWRDDNHYYQVLPTIEMMNQEKEYDSFSMKNCLYNAYTVEHMDYLLFEMDPEYYLYMVIQPTENFKLANLACYIRAKDSCIIYLYAWITSQKPEEKICSYRDDVYRDDAKTEYYEYYDPKIDQAEAHTSVECEAEKWTSFCLNFNEQGQGSSVPGRLVRTDEYIVLRFENNSGYGREKGLDLVEFQLINLMVRCKE